MDPHSPAQGLSNSIRIGTVTELHAGNALCRVSSGEIITDWIPWLSSRAGPGVRTWAAPEVGEQVLFVCPAGDLGQAVIVGSIYSDDHPAPADREEVLRSEFADGTTIEYDRGGSVLTINVGTGRVIVNCQRAAVHAAASVFIDAPTVHATGSISAEGNLAAGTGASGTFTTPTGSTVTVDRGIVTNIF